MRKSAMLVMLKRIGNKKDLCLVGVCNASYHNDPKSLAGEIIMLGNKKIMDVLEIRSDKESVQVTQDKTSVQGRDKINFKVGG